MLSPGCRSSQLPVQSVFRKGREGLVLGEGLLARWPSIRWSRWSGTKDDHRSAWRWPGLRRSHRSCAARPPPRCGTGCTPSWRSSSPCPQTSSHVLSPWWLAVDWIRSGQWFSLHSAGFPEVLINVFADWVYHISWSKSFQVVSLLSQSQGQWVFRRMRL